MNQPDQNLVPPPAVAGNGILARVPGQYIAQGCLSLPNPLSTTAEELTAEVDAGWAGRVLLTFTKYRYRRSKDKTSSVIWLCRRADPVEPATEQSPPAT